MRKPILGIMILAVAGLSSTWVQAGTDSGNHVSAMSQDVYTILLNAQKAIKTSRFEIAFSELVPLLGLDGTSAYEKGQIWNLIGHGRFLQANYPLALEAYKNVLSQGGLPQGLLQATHANLSQIYHAMGNNEKAVKQIDELLDVTNTPTSEMYTLKARIYFENQEYRKAKKSITRAIENNKKKGRGAKEDWLLLLQACHHRLNEYDSMIEVLHQLILLSPKAHHFFTLLGVYNEVEDTKNQLALSEALYEIGILDEENYLINLANLYLIHEIPYKAARLLEREIGEQRIDPSELNLQLLSQAWHQARENSRVIDPLARAAEMSKSGELYLQLARSYLDISQWRNAIESIQKALNKQQQPEREDTVNMLLGTALYHEQEFGAAREAFVRAARDKRSAKLAGQWINHLDDEAQRKKTLNKLKS